MTRPRLDDLTSDQYEALCGALDRAERLLRQTADLMAITHRYGALGGHDVIGAGLGCAGCDLRTRINQHLNRKDT